MWRDCFLWPWPNVILCNEAGAGLESKPYSKRPAHQATRQQVLFLLRLYSRWTKNLKIAVFVQFHGQNGNFPCFTPNLLFYAKISELACVLDIKAQIPVFSKFVWPYAGFFAFLGLSFLTYKLAVTPVWEVGRRLIGDVIKPPTS